MNPNNQLYLKRGLTQILRPGVRRFVYIPVAFNLLLYVIAGVLLFDLFNNQLSDLLEGIPDWLSFVVPLLWMLFAVFMVVLFGYSFVLVTSILASPFNALLAERVANDWKIEAGLVANSDSFTLKAALAMAGQSIIRELEKLRYFVPRLIILLLLSFTLGLIPVVGLIVTLIVFAWGSWSLSIQFIDFCADNDGFTFKETIYEMKEKRTDCLIFGATVMGMMAIPIINILAIPAAIAGGTLLWLEKIDSSANAELSKSSD